jgi:Flp pilus assembly protein CpaB
LKRSNRLILLIGLFLAVVAFVGVILLTGNNSTGGGTPTTTPVPTTAKVVKAATDIAAGTKITASMVEQDEVPLAAAGPNTIPDTGLAIGKTIRQSVTKGETVTYSFFISSGVETNVTDALPKGLRGIAVQVSQVTGVGTLIQNGDHVDVVISMKIQTVANDPKNPPQVLSIGSPAGSVKMVFQNALVIGTLLPAAPATTTATASPTPAPSGQTSQGAQGPSTSLDQARGEIVIIAVTPNQAEIIRYAQLYADGPVAGAAGTADNISLVLRSPKDYIKLDGAGNPVLDANGVPVAVVPPADTTDGIILKTLIDKYGVLPPDLLNK